MEMRSVAAVEPQREEAESKQAYGVGLKSRLLRRMDLDRRLRDLKTAFESSAKLAGLPALSLSADYLSESDALRIARCASRLANCFPPYGKSETYYNRRAIYQEGGSADVFSKPHLEASFRDYVFSRRLLQGRQDPRSFRYEEKNEELVHDLREDGCSFVLATGHFCREAMLPVYFEQVTPQQVSVVVARTTPGFLDPGEVWARVALGMLFRYLQEQREDTTLVRRGDLGCLRQLMKSLRQPGNAVIIAADAPWCEGSGTCYSRPFGGNEECHFSTGPATLGRLSQSPVVICTPYYEEESGKIVIDWRSRIEPPDSKDRNADRRNTERILQELERAAFRRPRQYLFDLNC